MICLLKINIVCIGKIKEKYIVDGIKRIWKRLSKYVSLSIIELKEEKTEDIDKESNTILKYILNNNNTFNVLLDIKGDIISSELLAEKIEKLTLNYSVINFIIGGSNGVNENLKKTVDYKLSFSKMTFPHQLMRLILIEQIYRSICINNNIKYHK